MIGNDLISYIAKFYQEHFVRFLKIKLKISSKPIFENISCKTIVTASKVRYYVRIKEKDANLLKLFAISIPIFLEKRDSVHKNMYCSMPFLAL